MRLALFTDTLGDLNGVARFVQDLAVAAHGRGRGRGLDLRVFASTRRPTPPLDNIVNLTPRTAIALPAYRTLDLAWPPASLAQAARAWRPDAIHVSTPGPVGLAGRALARRLGVPLVATHHTDFPAFVARLAPHGLRGEGARATRAYLRWFYRPARCVLARSAASLTGLAGLGVAPGRVHVLRAGIDLSVFHPGPRDAALRRRFHLKPDGKVALYAGRLSRDKDLDVLARAWLAAHACLAARGTASVLLLAGEGPFRAGLERMLTPSAARFLGPLARADLAALYRSCDVLVTPSRTDTLGQCVMEALASGLPAVVSDAGGPATLVRDGETGVIVPSSGSWDEALAHLLLDDARRARLSARAAEDARAWDFVHSLQDFWSVHEGVVARASADDEG